MPQRGSENKKGPIVKGPGQKKVPTHSKVKQTYRGKARGGSMPGRVISRISRGGRFIGTKSKKPRMRGLGKGGGREQKKIFREVKTKSATGTRNTKKNGHTKTKVIRISSLKTNQQRGGGEKEKKNNRD